MAVVIQELIPSTESGTLFMANPVTHNVKEAIVEAIWGLGELLVSGRVTPDTYYISLNSAKPVLIKKVIKTKRRMMITSPTIPGGTCEVAVPPYKSDLQVLPDQTILELVRMGIVLTKHYGYPLDIEWARYAKHLYILQARPITSLKPLC
jgi:phosphoenolpyruvate synthase/pyruvate phosphate dikinase